MELLRENFNHRSNLGGAVPQTPRPILQGRVNFPLCLAPMVGLSHWALRRVVRSYTPAQRFPLWPSEMLNSKRLPVEDLTQVPSAFKDAEEGLIVPQILGNERDAILASITVLKNWGAVGIDINMGCPVQKALRHNYGVALMGDPHYAAQVVAMASDNPEGLPVSVKLRAGLQQSSPEFLLEFCQGLIRAGAQWLTLHPRLAEQKRRGAADWSQIKWLRDRVAVPVIGNGDVQNADDFFALWEQTGCDLVMAGRGLAARPWMMWQVGERLGLPAPPNRQGSAPTGPEQEAQEYGRVLVELLTILAERLSPALALRRWRYHVRMTSCFLDFGHELMALTTRSEDLSQNLRNVEDFFAQHSELRFNLRTQLRE